MKTQPSFVLERDWTSFNVENFIEFFERLKLESTEPCDRILLVLNRVNHRHVDRLMHKIHKSGRSLPVEIKICRDSLWRQYQERQNAKSNR